MPQSNHSRTRESIAGEHVDLMFAELDTALRKVKSNLTPRAIVRRHPIATTVAGALAGLLLARLLFKKKRRKATKQSAESAPEKNGNHGEGRFTDILRWLAHIGPPIVLLALSRMKHNGR